MHLDEIFANTQVRELSIEEKRALYERANELLEKRELTQEELVSAAKIYNTLGLHYDYHKIISSWPMEAVDFMDRLEIEFYPLEIFRDHLQREPFRKKDVLMGKVKRYW